MLNVRVGIRSALIVGRRHDSHGVRRSRRPEHEHIVLNRCWLHIQLRLLYLRLKLSEEVEIEHVLVTAAVIGLFVAVLGLAPLRLLLAVVDGDDLRTSLFFAFILLLIGCLDLWGTELVLEANVGESVALRLLLSAAAERLIPSSLLSKTLRRFAGLTTRDDLHHERRRRQLGMALDDVLRALLLVEIQVGQTLTLVVVGRVRVRPVDALPALVRVLHAELLGADVAHGGVVAIGLARRVGNLLGRLAVLVGVVGHQAIEGLERRRRLLVHRGALILLWYLRFHVWLGQLCLW